MKITELLNAIWLGLMQGVTEFLPISSSAHLIVSSWLVDGQPLSLELNLALHFGSALAILLYFRSDWRKLILKSYLRLTTGEHSFESRVLLPALIVGTIPAAVIGFSFEKSIEKHFHSPFIVTIPLFLVGILLWFIDKNRPRHRDLQNLTIKDALIIGFAQAAALIPGVSRSGSTIIAGRMQNFDRTTAAKFSFLLGIPVILGASLVKAPDIIKMALYQPTFYVGMLSSFISGLLTIHFLMKFIQRYSFAWFAVYRCLLAIAIVLVLIQQS